MLFPSVCRVCLSTDRQMKVIANTQLQRLFEKLTNNELITSDGRPESVCYLCHLQLEKCWKFAEMSRRAEMFLSGFFASGVQPTEKNLITNCSLLRHNTSLVLTAYTTIISIPCSEEDTEGAVSIKVEEKTYDVMLKPEENTTIEVKENENKVTKPFNQGSSDKVGEDDNYYAPTPLPTKHLDTVTEKFKQTEKEIEIIVKDLKSNKKNQPTFKCDKCPKIFRQKGYLKRHLRLHTGEKPYKCKICAEAFSDSTILKLHTRMHNGEAPYICHVCAKSFNHKPQLREHIRTHTGEKPHACQHCTSSFSHQGSLTRHMRIHSGEKPYMCHTCSRRFTQQCNLRKHIRTCNVEKSKHVCVKCKHKD